MRGWRPHDPGLFTLRSAVRASLVTTVAFFLGEVVIDNPDIALFAAFGSMAMLVFADLGGPPVARLTAYVGLAVAGAVVIPLGTLVSAEPWLGAATMAVVGFTILFAGVINGYIAASSTSVLLLFILPCMVPADAAAIPDRLAGWGIAVALSIPAALLLFPGRQRDELRAAVAATCRAVADLIADGGPASREAADAACVAMHRQFTATPYRPTGPTGAAGALAAMIDDLDWLHGRASLPSTTAPLLEPMTGELQLRRSTAGVLRASGDLLDGRPAPPPDEAALERDRAAVLTELLERVRDPAVRDDDDRLWYALSSSWDVRVYSYAAVRTAELARVASTAPSAGRGPRWSRFARRQGVLSGATTRLAAAHTSVRSVWFVNSLRGAAGLTLAVFIAAEASLQHAFWVVLGTLSVLRSSALTTGSTIVKALVGCSIGIVVGGALLALIGADETLLWVLLPIAVLVAAYAPRAISFAAGQAAFTVAILLLFNLIAPSGWQVGLVRIEDVSIGFGISLLVGLLFWPRGATQLLHDALGAAFATAAGYASAAFTRLFEDVPDEPVRERAAAALAADSRLDVALRQRLAERGGPTLRLDAVSRLVAIAVRIRHTADALEFLSDRVVGAPRPEPLGARLSREAHRTCDWYGSFGTALATDVTRVPAPTGDDEIAARRPVLDAMRAATGQHDHAVTMAAITMVWGVLHLARLRYHERIVVGAAAQLSAPAGSAGERSR